MMAMTLDELKIRINATADDLVLQTKLDDAIDFVCGYLHRTFNDEKPMPLKVKRIVAKYVQSELTLTDGIKSESIDGLSQTFESKSERENAIKAELRSTGLRKFAWYRG